MRHRHHHLVPLRKGSVHCSILGGKCRPVTTQRLSAIEWSEDTENERQSQRTMVIQTLQVPKAFVEQVCITVTAIEVASRVIALQVAIACERPVNWNERMQQ